MPRPPVDSGPPPPSTPPPSGDAVNDAWNAAEWSRDYYNRRAGEQYVAIVALQIAIGALAGG